MPKQFLCEATYAQIAYQPQAVRDLLERYKVVVLRDYAHEQAPERFFDRFSEGIGQVIPTDEDLDTGQPTGRRWIDITYDPDLPLRYRSAAVAQPLHTDFSYVDLPGNVQFLYCVSQAERGGATTFIDADEVVTLLKLAGQSHLLEQLQALPVTFSKLPRHRTSPILWRQDGDWHFNWNYFCIDPQANAEQRALVEALHRFLESRVVPSGLLTACLLKPHDAVFFHDEKVLHGRHAYFARHKGGRCLLKGTLLLS